MSIPVASHILYELRRSLPPPPEDTPEARDARDQAAIGQYIALAAGDLAETQLAIQHVAACAQALDCMRMVSLPDATPQSVFRHRQQAIAMMRASQAALRALQAAQRQRTGHKPVAAATASPVQPTAQPAAAQRTAPPSAPPSLEPDPIVAAEAFARQFPTRAARIRRAGGVPPDAAYAVPPPHVIQALVTGNTKHLRRLNRLAV